MSEQNFGELAKGAKEYNNICTYINRLNDILSSLDNPSVKSLIFTKEDIPASLMPLFKEKFLIFIKEIIDQAEEDKKKLSTQSIPVRKEVPIVEDDKKKLVVKIFATINDILEELNGPDGQDTMYYRKALAQKIKEYFTEANLSIDALEDALRLLKIFKRSINSP